VNIVEFTYQIVPHQLVEIMPEGKSILKTKSFIILNSEVRTLLNNILILGENNTPQAQTDPFTLMMMMQYMSTFNHPNPQGTRRNNSNAKYKKNYFQNQSKFS